MRGKRRRRGADGKLERKEEKKVEEKKKRVCKNCLREIPDGTSTTVISGQVIGRMVCNECYAARIKENRSLLQEGYERVTYVARFLETSPTRIRLLIRLREFPTITSTTKPPYDLVKRAEFIKVLSERPEDKAVLHLSQKEWCRFSARARAEIAERELPPAENLPPEKDLPDKRKDDAFDVAWVANAKIDALAEELGSRFDVSWDDGVPRVRVRPLTPATASL